MTSPTPLSTHPLFRHPAAAGARLAMAELLKRSRTAGYETDCYPLPDSSAGTIPAGSVVEVRLSLPVGSYVVGFSGQSSDAAGYELQITDLRHNSLFFSAAATSKNVQSQGSYPESVSLPIVYLDTPRLVIEPAVLIVRIRNLAAAAATIQVCLFTLEPAKT